MLDMRKPETALPKCRLSWIIQFCCCCGVFLFFFFHTETPLSKAKVRSQALWDHLSEPLLSECRGDVQTATQMQEKGHCRPVSLACFLFG